jgi:hypothetical protein
MTNTKTKLVETLACSISVTQKDIDGGISCDQNNCMQQIAWARFLEVATRGEATHVKVVAGKVRWRWRGHHWSADLPRKATAALIQYDNQKTRHLVKPHSYKATAFKGNKIQTMLPEHRERLDACRNAKIRAGISLNGNRQTLRQRIVGLA